MSLPIQDIEYSQVARYEKKRGNTTKLTWGVESRPGYYHPHVDYNEFELVEKKIPDGFNRVPMSIENIKNYYFNKDKKLLTEDNAMYKKIKEDHEGDADYFIHHNGSRPYLVYVNSKNNKVDIYKIPLEEYYVKGEGYDSKSSFVELIASYEPIQVFIGKSKLYISEFDGNSILLRLNKEEYVYIGPVIYEFKTDDDITIYHSPVGNSDVPYPFAIGEKNVYFVEEQCYVTREEYDAYVPKNCTDASHYYYSPDCNLGKNCGHIIVLKIVHKC
jgi:hypothetical protein